jgi:RHS repeat-associated protein
VAAALGSLTTFGRVVIQISSDPGGNNGAVNYTYDPVGNRTNQASSIPAIASGGAGYDADDRFTLGDTYDANGNTTSSGGISNTYDFENHLVQQGGATMVYDGDGNRAQKIIGGVTTNFVTASVNPTGYAQVVAENFSGSGTHDSARYFVYGLERISQQRQFVANNQNQTQISYYIYDGHGSVRALTDPTGNVTDTYDYDAFGNLIHSTGTTPNEFLFAGEQFDSELHLYYNRARYLNTNTGRFWTMDTYDGDSGVPLSLHKYLYAFAGPVNQDDPSGKSVEGVWGTLLHNQIYPKFQSYLLSLGHVGFTNASIAVILNLPEEDRALEGAYDRPDLVDVTAAEVYEIKPAWLYEEAEADIEYYIYQLGALSQSGQSWEPGTTFNATGEYTLQAGVVADVEPTEGGAILYTIRSTVPTLVPVDVLAEGEEGVGALARIALAADEAELAEIDLDVSVAPAF